MVRFPSRRSNLIRITTLGAMAALLSACVFSNDPRVRTPGTVIDDEVLESKVERDIRASSEAYKGSNLEVVSYNGLVLLLGQVASEELKLQATNIAQGVTKVKRVHNELTIGGPISYPARTNDSYLTSKVKAKLFADKAVDGGKINVTTENGVVYLMGILPRDEADRAVEVASTVFGVQKIVKVFEYLEPTVIVDPTASTGA